MTAPKRSSMHAQRGIALIEVLVSILLFSFGILGLMGLQARAVSFSIDAEDRNRAALLANEAASLIVLNKSVTIPAPALTAWEERVKDVDVSGLSNGEGTITPVSGSANSADILITWKAPSRNSTDQASQYTTRVTLP